MDYNDNEATTNTLNTQILNSGVINNCQRSAGNDNQPIRFQSVDNMEKMIGYESHGLSSNGISTRRPIDYFKIQTDERPIINGVFRQSPESPKDINVLELKTENSKSNTTTWQQLSPKREQPLSRQNSNGSSGSNSGGSNASSPSGSPTKSWKSVREANKNIKLSWRDLSPTKSAKMSDTGKDNNSETSRNNTESNAQQLSPKKVANQNDRINSQTNTEIAITQDRGKSVDNQKDTVSPESLAQCAETTHQTSGIVNNQNEIKKLQLSPEHKQANKKDLCRNNSGTTDDTINNEYFYDEDFSVQFDTNLRESSPGLSCTCVDPALTSDFPHMVTGSYLSFNNMKGSVSQNNSTELFCPDESELSSCRNSAMDMSSSERDMMCSSDMLDFSDNPLFTPSPTRDLGVQNVSTDSLDKNTKCQGHAMCQNNGLDLSTSRTSSDGGNLCINCCPRKDEYFLSFDGSQGRSGTNSDNDNSMTSIGSGQGHWVQSSSEDGVEECSDSFHFCYISNGNSHMQQGKRRKKFQSLKAVQENSLEECVSCGEDVNKTVPSSRMEIKVAYSPGHKVQSQTQHKYCLIGKKSVGPCGMGSPKENSPSKSPLTSRKSKNVTSWKQVKSLKKLGKIDSLFDPTRSNSMPELFVETWQSFTSQDCQDIVRLAESFHSKRHSAYLLDLYQRVKAQSNPVSPETMANIEQILFHPLVNQTQFPGEQNLSLPAGQCCNVCGKEGSHSSHTLTNSNVQQMVNNSRSGQLLDYYTRKRIIDWLDKDKLLDSHSKVKSCQTEKEMKTAETIISPTTVTLWCGTKNFGSQFPPCTKDCGIQTSDDEEMRAERLASVEQQTTGTLEREHKKSLMNEVSLQTSPMLDNKTEILSMLPDHFKDLDEILPRRQSEYKPASKCHIPRSKSADHNVKKMKSEDSSSSYYTHKSLPDLSFLASRSDLIPEGDISLFDPLPAGMPIPVLIQATDLSKSKESTSEKSNLQQSRGRDNEPHSGSSNIRSRSAPAKMLNPQLAKTCGESGSSSSGFSTSSTSSGIDPGYYSDPRSYHNGSPSNDIERLLFFPPHVEISTKQQAEELQTDQIQVETPQYVPQSQQHPKLCRLSDKKVNKYANEVHPGSLDVKSKMKTVPKSSGEVSAIANKSASDSNLHLQHLYALQEEKTPVSSPEQQCQHTCCHGDECYYGYNKPSYSYEIGGDYYEGMDNEHLVLQRKFDYHCQLSSESGSSSSGSLIPNIDKKPLKSCLRKKHLLRSRSISDPFNIAQQTEMHRQKQKVNRHSYACEEVYLLTDESGHYYLCQNDPSQTEEFEPVLFYRENNDSPSNVQPVKLRRKKTEESAGGSENGEKDNLSGKRKSVSFASEVSFHAISPQSSPKRLPAEETEDSGDVIEVEKSDKPQETDATDSQQMENADSSESDSAPQDFSLSPPREIVYDKRFAELEKKRAMLTEVCHCAEILVNHFNKAKNPFDKLRLGSTADCSDIGELVLSKLCPALSQVVGDGLKTHLNGLQMFGRVQITVWKVAELSAEQGPYTRAIHDLVQQLKNNSGLVNSYVKFEAFLFGLLNLRLLDYWMGYLRYNDTITEKCYNSDAVIMLGKSCYERTYDEVLISLQPLAVLPFQLSTDYVVENTKQVSRSPISSPVKSTQSPPSVNSPIRNKLSPGESPSNTEKLIPPPKPARLDKTANSSASSNKAWDWLKGNSNSLDNKDGNDQSTLTNSMISSVTGMLGKLTGMSGKEEHSDPSVKHQDRHDKSMAVRQDLSQYDNVDSEASDPINSGKAKNVSQNKDDEDLQKRKETFKLDLEVNEPRKIQKSSVKEEKSMTDSFSGIAHKLLGINSQRDKNLQKPTVKDNTDHNKSKQRTERSSHNPRIDMVPSSQTHTSSHRRVPRHHDNNQHSSSDVKNLTAVTNQEDHQTSVEGVSSKAKSGLIKLFDKLLLSKENTQKSSAVSTNMVAKKRLSWNSGIEHSQAAMSSKELPSSKSLSPVDNGLKSSSGSSSYQQEKLETSGTKHRTRSNVVARSIQNEAIKPDKTSQHKKTKVQMSEDKEMKHVATVSNTKKEIRSHDKQVKQNQAVNEDVTKVRQEISQTKPDHLPSSPRKSNEKSRVSKIPTLKNMQSSLRKSERGSKIPKRNSLVLESSGSEQSSPCSSAVNSPVRVRQSKSVEHISSRASGISGSPLRINRVKVTDRTLPVSSDECDNSELVQMSGGSSSNMTEPDRTSSDMNQTSSDLCESGSSSVQCASLETGPVIMAPPSIKYSLENSGKGDNSKQTAVANTTTLQPSEGHIELDINSNSPLQNTADGTSDNFSATNYSKPGTTESSVQPPLSSAKNNDTSDFLKPDFRYIQTMATFQSAEASQLSYKRGEHFEVLAEIDSSWFYCVNGRREGLIHVSAVKPLTDQDEFNTLHNGFYS